jgi:hypothetical protein
MVCAGCGLSQPASAQTISAEDTVFSPSDWSSSFFSSSGLGSASMSQVVDGYATGANALRSTLSPGGTGIRSWSVGIFEGFSYEPLTAPGTVPESVVVSFESRWTAVGSAWVGAAFRQGSSVWVTQQLVAPNTSSWSSYTFSSDWGSLQSLAGGVSGPDFSLAAPPIFFGLYQMNSGNSVGRQTEFASFTVTVVVPAPAVAAPIVLIASVGSAFGRRRRL